MSDPMTHPHIAAIREALENAENICRVENWPENRSIMKNALEHLSALEAQRGWQPIETAPKDGTRILAWCEQYAAPLTLQYYDNIKGWCIYYEVLPKHRPTHWQPLPLPPGHVAQRIEQGASIPSVGGSSPSVTTNPPAQLSEEEMVGVMEIGEATLLDIATSLEKWLFPIIRLHEEENGRFSWSHYEALTVIKEAIRPYLTIANVTKKEGV